MTGNLLFSWKSGDPPKGEVIIGFHQQRAERVYKASLAVCILVIIAVSNYATAVWARPDPECSFLASKSKVIRESQNFMVMK